MNDVSIPVKYPRDPDGGNAPKVFIDINPLAIGYERCEKGHAFGPAIRTYYLIHFVSKGTGTLYAGNAAWKVNAGEMFVIYPDEVTTYAADLNDPWTYGWLGFSGRYARRFCTPEKRVYKVSDLYFNKIKELADNARSADADYLISLIYRLIFELFGGENSADSAETVKNYIDNNYMKDVTVEQIARTVYLDRRYLGRIFKQKTGCTVRDYLISVRMENAAKFLRAGYSVTQCANMCGYRDAFNFSKMFKKHFSVSPKHYRKSL